MCLKYKNSRKAKIFPAIFLLDNLINNANLMTLVLMSDFLEELEEEIRKAKEEIVIINGDLKEKERL